MSEHRERIAELAKQARGGIETLLEVLGWPTDELVFHRAIDRLLQLGEQT
jgi:hypothetical protein